VKPLVRRVFFPRHEKRFGNLPEPRAKRLRAFLQTSRQQFDFALKLS
jgi:hypothetical protein